jgi:UDP-glucose 4-epimerase
LKLLVTGGAGYIGSVVAMQLLEEGHEVTVLDDLSKGHESAVPEGAKFVRVDLLDVATTESYTSQPSPWSGSRSSSRGGTTGPTLGAP